MKRQKPINRAAGILMPISSLPSPYGIGTLGEAAYNFVDFLKKAGQSYWQVLPVGPTSYGDSPYQSFSAFAGNPYFIDPEILMKEGLISREDADSYDWGEDEESVDYQKLYEFRLDLLKIAYKNSRHKEESSYISFCEDNSYWLSDYAEYMAIKKHYGEQGFVHWPIEIRTRKLDALKKMRKELSDEIDFEKFCQFHFFNEWKKLKDYANRSGVRIIGDVPIYVSLDSADVWAGKEEFLLDDELRPVLVAGVPPDEFSDDGQLWGTPLYNWDEMEKNGFTWWKLRLGFSAQMFDIVRIDHFIGIQRYYAVDAKNKTARHGTWHKGPGIKLLEGISEAIGETKIIAEDLGAITPAVTRLRLRAGYPGMKILEYAFTSDGENSNLPHFYDENCVVYSGTHDNETLVGYFKHAPKDEIAFAKKYLQVKSNKMLAKATIRAAYSSVAPLCIIQMQDFLGLDNRARMNYPSTLGGNWKWRIKAENLTDELAKEIYELSQVYGRLEEKDAGV